MKEWLNQHKAYAAIVCITVIILVLSGYTLINHSAKKKEVEMEWSGLKQQSVKEEQDKTFSNEEKIKTNIELLVDVKGSVVNPGVYEAEEGDRVKDLINKAGGLDEKADVNQVNFAMRVTDEMVIYIPEFGEVTAENSGVIGGLVTKEGDHEKVNINSADETELQTLPGIGPSRAAAIIEYRETSGPYKDIEDIKSISGIGEKTFEKLQESISIK